MMDAGGYLVKGIMMIILILVFVAIINLFLPFIMKAKLNDIGKEYVNLMEVENGLTVSEKSEILTELTDKGFENVTVNASLKGTVSFKDSLVLEIIADFPIRMFGIFSSNINYVPMNYKQELKSKRIEE